MNWIHIDESLPDKDKRILIYSPVYEGIDERMLFRVIDSRFLLIVKEAKYWMYLTPPEEES